MTRLAPHPHPPPIRAPPPNSHLPSGCSMGGSTICGSRWLWGQKRAGSVRSWGRVGDQGPILRQGCPGALWESYPGLPSARGPEGFQRPLLSRDSLPPSSAKSPGMPCPAQASLSSSVSGPGSHRAAAQEECLLLLCGVPVPPVDLAAWAFPILEETLPLHLPPSVLNQLPVSQSLKSPAWTQVIPALLLRPGSAPPHEPPSSPPRGSSYPPPPPVEQEPADGQQDQDDTGHQQAEDKTRELGVGGFLVLPLMACVSQRNGVKTGRGPGRPLTCLSSFQLCGTPPVPGAPPAFQLPKGQHVAPGMAPGELWLRRAGGGTAEALRAQRWGLGQAWLLVVSGRGSGPVCLLRCVTPGLRGSHGAQCGQVCASCTRKPQPLSWSRECWRCWEDVTGAGRLCLDPASSQAVGGKLCPLGFRTLTSLSGGLFQGHVSTQQRVKNVFHPSDRGCNRRAGLRRISRGAALNAWGLWRLKGLAGAPGWSLLGTARVHCAKGLLFGQEGAAICCLRVSPGQASHRGCGGGGELLRGDRGQVTARGGFGVQAVAIRLGHHIWKNHREKEREGWGGDRVTSLQHSFPRGMERGCGSGGSPQALTQPWGWGEDRTGANAHDTGFRQERNKLQEKSKEWGLDTQVGGWGQGRPENCPFWRSSWPDAKPGVTTASQDVE